MKEFMTKGEENFKGKNTFYLGVVVYKGLFM